MMANLDTPLLIESVGDYYHLVDEEHGQVSLKAVMAAECPTRFRRIDRYTQLALLGSRRCVGDQVLDRKTGLYTGSRFASLSNTTQVHSQMVVHGNVPKPAHFINTLSNSAGYYVARNLGLDGRNLFVSREDASLVAALQLASLDLASGAISRALVGVVDETGSELDHQRRRLGVPAGTELGEGSHWLLVTRQDPATPGAGAPVLQRLATLADDAALRDWLAERVTGEDQPRVWWPDHLAELPAPAAGFDRFHSGLACYAAAIGGAISRYLDSGCRQPLVLLAPDGAKRYHGLLLQP